MKNLKIVLLFLSCVLLLILSNCQRFDIATLKITYCDVTENAKGINCTAQVIDNGGCKYFVEQGFCYSLLDSMPNLNQLYTTVVPVAYTVFSTAMDTFSWKQEYMEFLDTTYFVRAYVKTNAGIAYSEVDTVRPLSMLPMK